MNFVEINQDNQKYSKLFKSIINPPQKIYALGNLKLLEEPSIAVIGTRHISDYGLRHGKEICKEFALRRIPIVSGLAVRDRYFST